MSNETMEEIIMRKFKSIKKTVSVIITALFVLGAAACGSRNAEIGDAAYRAAGEGAGEFYIDNNAIILSGEFKSTEEINAALSDALALVNAQRAAAGLSALVWSEGLADAAAVRAHEITTLFSHTRPDGSNWWTVNSTLQYGENLAKLYQSSSSVVDAWMNSPTHRANIMDGSFVTVGMAIYQTDNGSWYWAQEFGY
jgi:uncharacterized protein YkwD